MIQKETYSENVKLFEEKIKNLYRALQELQPSIRLTSRSFENSLEFPLDPTDQSNFRKEYLRKIIEVPSLPQISLYSETLEKEFNIEILNASSFPQFMKQFISKRIEKQSFCKYKLMLKSLKNEKIPRKTIENQIQEINDELKKLSETFLKLSAVNDFSFERALDLDDIMIYFNDQIKEHENCIDFERFFAKIK